MKEMLHPLAASASVYEHRRCCLHALAEHSKHSGTDQLLRHLFSNLRGLSFEPLFQIDARASLHEKSISLYSLGVQRTIF